MKKILIIISIIILVLLIAFGVFYFFGNGKQRVANFFSDNTFGSFFDVETQSRNDFVNVPNIEPTPTIPQSTGPYEAPALRQISFEPISGYTFYATTSTTTQTTISFENEETVFESVSTSTVIRFQERITGHVYDVFESTLMPEKISNITEQKIYSTLFSNNKDQFVYQKPIFNNEQIQSTLGTLSFSTTTGTELTRNTISNNITDFVFNKISNSLIYSIKQGDTSALYTSNIDRTGEKLITTLSFNEFLIDIINKDEALITTKASRNVPGYAYTLNTTTGSLTKILGNINGLLVKVSPDKKYYIYSKSEQNRPSTRIYTTTNNTVALLSIDTLASEKCIFAQKNVTEAYCFGSLIYKNAQYPDDWYKGKILNLESLYKINLENSSVTPVYNFQADELNFDVINIQITNDDKFIIFQNKYDLTLWSLDLSKLSNELN